MPKKLVATGLNQFFGGFFFGSVQCIGVLGQLVTSCGCWSVQIGLKARPDQTCEHYKSPASTPFPFLWGTYISCRLHILL